MKTLFLIVLLTFSGIFAYSQSSFFDFLKNQNYIGTTKDSLVAKENPPQLLVDTLNGQVHDILKVRKGKMLITYYFSNKENKTDIQTCIYFKVFLVTAYFNYEEISSKLDKMFKKIGKDEWIQIRDNDTLLWKGKLTDYTITITAGIK